MICVMCNSQAEVEVAWLVTSGEQRHKLCDRCAHDIWDQISTRFSGTEAHMSFSIDSLNVKPE